MDCPDSPYASLEYANDFFACIPGSLWGSFCEDDQIAALLAAAYQLDIRYGPCYIGYVYVDPDADNVDEDFEFLQPRDGYYTFDGRYIKPGVIAKTIKNVTCLLAIKTLKAVSDSYDSDSMTDMHDGRRVKSFSQDSPDIFNESYTYYDDGADNSESDMWSAFDVMMAPHLEPGCCPGEPCEDDNFFVSDLCLGG